MRRQKQITQKQIFQNQISNEKNYIYIYMINTICDICCNEN